MPLEKKQPTKSLEERTVDVISAIAVLDILPKYPARLDQLKFFAKMIAQFTETVEVNHTDPENPRPSDLGWVVPLAWLVEQVGQTYFYFPPPIKWRQIYETRFVSLDGQTCADLEADAE